MATEEESPESESDESGSTHPLVSEEITDSQLFVLIDQVVEDIASARNNPVLTLLYPFHGDISPLDALEVYEIFIHNSDIEDLDIILHSGGGDIHEAYDIIRLCRRHTSGEVTVFVPMRAMSAATLIALGADKVVLSDIGKLGPLDPQVSHPKNNQLIPIRAITDLPAVLERAMVPVTSEISIKEKGESIIKPLAEQVDPYHLTMHERTTDLAKEYGIKVLGDRGFSQEMAERCIDYLIEYPAHSFSVDIREIHETASLGDVIDADTIHELDNPSQIEWGLVSLIHLYIYWNVRSIRGDDTPMHTHVKLIQPPEPEQQTLEEIDEETVIEVDIPDEEIEDLPDNLQDVIDELEESGEEESDGNGGIESSEGDVNEDEGADDIEENGELEEDSELE